jgi:hypothetical protein
VRGAPKPLGFRCAVAPATTVGPANLLILAAALVVAAELTGPVPPGVRQLPGRAPMPAVA